MRHLRFAAAAARCCCRCLLFAACCCCLAALPPSRCCCAAALGGARRGCVLGATARCMHGAVLARMQRAQGTPACTQRAHACSASMQRTLARVRACTHVHACAHTRACAGTHACTCAVCACLLQGHLLLLLWRAAGRWGGWHARQLRWRPLLTLQADTAGPAPEGTGPAGACKAES